MRGQGKAGNLEQIHANSTVEYFEACVACDSFWVLFLNMTLCRSSVSNTMLLLIKNEMTGVVQREKKVGLKDLKQTTANQTLQLSAAENKWLLMCPFGQEERGEL